MHISIIGTGYVGLVSGVCFASKGHHVTCVDIDAEKVTRLQDGHLTIYEPGLEDLFREATAAGCLHFTTDLAAAVADSEVVFLALPTPPGEDGSADLSYVLGVARQLGPMLNGYTVIVDKSTVPVGTAARVTAAIETSGKIVGQDFDVVANPEFLREGVAVPDFLHPDRVVLGTNAPRAALQMERLYQDFVERDDQILRMDPKSAEMTKYAANALLATKITFMNEVANLCARVGADVDAVRMGVGSDHRIGPAFLYPGLGFGGSCFPKDVQALGRTAAANAYRFDLLSAVLNVNARQFEPFVEDIRKAFGHSLKGRRLAVWGLAFKANTDDVRESPAHRVIQRLVAYGAEIVAYDPAAMSTTRAVLGDVITYASSMEAALDGADALVICTEWNDFREADLDQLRNTLNQPLIFDGRNLFDPNTMAAHGFRYVSVGRPSYAPQQPVGLQQLAATALPVRTVRAPLCST